MEKIELDVSRLEGHVSQEEILQFQDKLASAKEKILNKSGEGSNSLSWVDLPENYDKEEYARVKNAAEKIRKDSEALVVIGIGGSYLGARAVIEALKPNFYNESEKLKIYFAGQNVSGKYLNNLINLIKDKEISIIVISKSGATTEPAIVFRVFKKLMEEKYGKENAKERIFAVTDKEKGALRKLAEKEEYETFIIPDNIGGRYSVLTAVGLLPIAAAGIDIDELMDGAKEDMEQCLNGSLSDNSPAYMYAAIRNTLYEKGKKIEILSINDPSLLYLAEWWKQLFGESEGKAEKGIFPASALYTTDLHSLGQYIQEGERLMFETFLDIAKPAADVQIEKADDDSDELNYLTGKSLNYVNQKAFLATQMAHQAGKVPNICFNIPEMNPFYLGKLMYIFEYACALSAYTLGVNPFNQPGVLEYKNNMFGLLNKPGY